MQWYLSEVTTNNNLCPLSLHCNGDDCATVMGRIICGDGNCAGEMFGR